MAKTYFTGWWEQKENVFLGVHLRDLPEFHCISFIFGKLTCRDKWKISYTMEPCTLEETQAGTTRWLSVSRVRFI